MSKFGLSKMAITCITDCIKRHVNVEKVIVFGSRAMGNYKKGSDVDLAIFGDKIGLDDVSKIQYELNEVLPLPYHFDVVNGLQIDNTDLEKHIKVQGKVFFRRR